MPLVLFDTSVYISALRQGAHAVLAMRRLHSGSVVWLSSVVLEELYAGTNERSQSAIQKLERDFDRAKRILIPNLSDWTEAGRVLSQVASKYNYETIGQGRLTNDTLVATSAGRAGIRVITTNERDFRRLAEFRPFQWEVASV